MKKPPRKIRAYELLPDSIKDEYQSGDSMLELAMRHSGNMQSVRRKLESLGVKIRRAGRIKGVHVETPQRKLSPAHVERILTLFTKNTSCAEIGRRFGVTGERIRQIVMENGIPPHRETKRPAKIKAALERVAQKKQKMEARDKTVETLSAIWKSGIISKEIGECVSYWRKRFPKLFPHRRPRNKVAR